MTRSRHNRGMGLPTVMMIIMVLVALVALVTSYVLDVSWRASRYAMAVQARALAEGGVEAMLAKLGDADAPDSFDMQIAGGKVSVRLTRGGAGAGRYRIDSEARRGVVCRVSVQVDVRDGVPVLVSREESTRVPR